MRATDDLLAPAQSVTYFDANGAADEIEQLEARIDALEKRLDAAPSRH